MGTALLILLAIIIVWFVFKAMSKNSSAGPDNAPALNNPATNVDPSAAASQVVDAVTDTAKGAAAAAAGAGSAAIAGAAAVAGSSADSHAGTDDNGLLPSTGNLVTDIAEMFKVLNLRVSDASRLSLSAEQYESLKSGETGGLSDDVLAGVMQKLKAML